MKLGWDGIDYRRVLVLGQKLNFDRHQLRQRRAVDTPGKLFEIDSGGDGWYPGLSNVVWLGWKFTVMPHYKRSI